MVPLKTNVSFFLFIVSKADLQSPYITEDWALISEPPWVFSFQLPLVEEHIFLLGCDFVSVESLS